MRKIKIYYFLIFALIVFISQAYAAPKNFSLMLSKAEQDALTHAIDQSFGPIDDLEKDDVIYLSAIAFFSPDKWIVWLNGQTITPDQLPSLPIVIKHVTAQNVTISIQGKPEKEFNLRPNQAIILSSEHIVDGQEKATPPAPPKEETKPKQDNTKSFSITENFSLSQGTPVIPASSKPTENNKEKVESPQPIESKNDIPKKEGLATSPHTKAN